MAIDGAGKLPQYSVDTSNITGDSISKTSTNNTNIPRRNFNIGALLLGRLYSLPKTPNNMKLLEEYANGYNMQMPNIQANNPTIKQTDNNTKVSGNDNANSDLEFAKNLPSNPSATVTTLQVGQGAEKIKGFYAKNPETGRMVYADQNGRQFTEQAFKNWEQFAKDGTFAS